MLERVGDPFQGIQRDPDAIERVAGERGLSAHAETLKRLLAEVRVIYTDVDGTLTGPGGCFFLNARYEYSLRAAAALVRILESGVDLVLVSGRNKRQLRENARFLGLRNFIAELGVLTVYDLGESEVLDLGSFGDDAAAFSEEMERTGALQWLLDEYADQIELHAPWALDRDYTALLRGLVDKAQVNERLQQVAPHLELSDNGVIPMRETRLEVPYLRAYHLMPRGVTKELAVARDMERRGVPRSAAVALGDAVTDLEFARAVGAFFLMKNGLHASPHLVTALPDFENAFVTDGFLNEGWSQALEFLLDNGLCAPFS